MSGKNLTVNLIANTSQFKSAMSETSNQIKLLNSEFKNAAAETDQYGNKLDSTGAKKKQLNGVIKQYQTRIKAIKDEQKHWTKELEKGNITEEQHAQKQQELARRLNNTEAEMKRYEGQLKKLNSEGKKSRMTYEEFDKQFRAVGESMQKYGAAVGVTTGAMFAGLVKVGKDAINVTKDFETEMSKVQALTKANTNEFGQMKDMAKQLGDTTMFSAQTAAEAMSFLGMAGFEVNEILDATPGLLDLAAAAQMDLGRAADITSNIISGFGMEASKAGKVSDVLAAASSNANTNVEQMGDSMATVAPIAATLGMSLEDMAAGTMIMSDAGLQGSQAGRMLRQGLIRLSKPTGDAEKLIKKLGVNVFDADGNMKSLDKVVAELEKGMKGMSSQAQTAALATLFGSESTAGWSALLKQGSGVLADYTKDLKNSEGAAKEMADTMQDNLQGSLYELESGIEGLQVMLGEKLIPIVRDGVDWFTELAQGLLQMDDATADTIASTALLTAGVLGVVSAIGLTTAAIGALMTFAGPLGVAIVGTTTLLGALGIGLHAAKKHTENLQKQQEEAKQEAIRYGDGVRSGTAEATKGYIDLYEGAKVEMLKLKTMSGEEAEKTKDNVVKAFKDMGDMVVAELESFADDFDKVVHEIYGVYEEAGKERADQIASTTREQTEEMIKDYERASETIGNIVEEFGNDTSKMPEDVRKTFDANMAIMQEGVGVFAVNYEDALRVRNTIASNSDKILFEETQKYASEIEKTHNDALASVNEQYNNQREAIEQFKILYPENAAEYDEMMQTLSTSTTAEIAKIDAARAESTQLLFENADTTGKLIDFQTGKAIERGEIEERLFTAHGTINTKRAESDEEYYLRYLKTNEDYLKALGDGTEKSLEFIEKSSYDWAISMGKTEKEAEQFAKDIRQKTLKEINGITEAGEIGKSTGDAYNQGLKSQEVPVKNGARQLSTGVKTILKGTDDGGGGKKAGNDLRSGLLGTRGVVKSAGVTVALSGRSGLASVDTSGTGRNFVSGFRNNINDNNGSIWSKAWNLGKTALSALNRSIRTASPSRETEETGENFVAGFVNPIEKGRKEAAKVASLVGKDTLTALNKEVKGFKQSFGAIALAVEDNKQILKVEHEINNSGLENKIDSLESVLEQLITIMAKKEEIKEQSDRPIVINNYVRNNDDINKIDSLLNNLSNRRQAAFGGGNN